MDRIIVSYGAGTNSTALLVGMVSLNIRPDAIIFSDTGGERPETYSYLSYFNHWLVQKGFPEITIVKYATKEGRQITLEEYLLEKKVLPPVAYGFKSCSDKFKIRPLEKFIKANFPKQNIQMYIGFDTGESRRIRTNPKKDHHNVYKLIEWGWDRKRCIEEIANVGLCLPGKSSCFFCPNMKKPEILELSSELKDRAIKIEQNAKEGLSELKGLGRQYAWKDLIESDQEQHKLFDDLDLFQKPCECID
jgi:hypothetical protein